MDVSEIHFCVSLQLTEVRFAGFLSGGYTTMAVINPSERKLAKRTSVQYIGGKGELFRLIWGINKCKICKKKDGRLLATYSFTNSKCDIIL